METIKNITKKVADKAWQSIYDAIVCGDDRCELEVVFTKDVAIDIEIHEVRLVGGSHIDDVDIYFVRDDERQSPNIAEAIRAALPTFSDIREHYEEGKEEYKAIQEWQDREICSSLRMCWA